MKRIRLLGLNIEGFQSFKNLTIIELDQAAGLRFLTGRNDIEPRLGANGAGKSSLWEAFYWCLYGITTKGKKASEVLSWGAKGLEVKALLSIDGGSVSIRRQSAPMKAYLDSKLVEQVAIDRLLGLSAGRFRQAIMFGQGARLFYDLDNAGRGALLDEILDLGLWLKLSANAATAAREAELAIHNTEREIQYTQGRLDSLPSAAAIQAQADAWAAKADERLETALAKAEEAEAASLEAEEVHKACLTKLAYLKAMRDAAPTPDEAGMASTSTLLSELRSNVMAGHKSIKFYEANNICPECGQDIDAAYKKQRLNRLKQATTEEEERLADTEVNYLELHRENQLRRGDYDNLVMQNNEMDRKAYGAGIAAQAAQSRLADAILEVEALGAGDETNPHIAEKEKLVTERANLTDAFEQQTKSMEAAQAQLARFEYWKNGFKKLRLWQMQRILSVLELEVMAAAAALGLVGWKIGISTEKELKSGDLKSGIHIQVRAPHAPGIWANQSGGEEQRGRLAVSMGFASLIQRMSGVHYELEIWDEPSNWLSESGIEDLLACLKDHARLAGKSVWVVDHRALGAAAFDEVWQVTKTADGSQLKQLTES